MQWGASFACMGMTVIFLMNDRAFLTVTAFAWETKIRRARGLLNGRKIRKIMHFRNPVCTIYRKEQHTHARAAGAQPGH